MIKTGSIHLNPSQCSSFIKSHDILGKIYYAYDLYDSKTF